MHLSFTLQSQLLWVCSKVKKNKGVQSAEIIQYNFENAYYSIVMHDMLQIEWKQTSFKKLKDCPFFRESF